MSEPRNHHYVSQTHLKLFYNEKDSLIYVYDKTKNNHFSKKTTKSLFSEKDLNTRLIENEKKDFSSLEKDLKINFEDDFNFHVKVIENIISHKTLSNIELQAIQYFTKYGIIGEFRTPRYKSDTDKLLVSALETISKKAVPELKKSIENTLGFKNQVKYLNATEYSEIAETILDSMGELIVTIETPSEKGDYFVIPDCSCVTERAKINTYFNPDIKEIAYIGLPLTSKIYLNVHSKKLFEKDPPKSQLIKINSKRVHELNELSLLYSQSKIACINNKYLRDFIKTLHNKKYGAFGK